jgi:hypothetical protein
MNNFRVFNWEELKLRLDGFAPGMAPHITPIKYEALTPDLFAFSFRTTGADNRDYYFVLLSFDSLATLKDVTDTIEEWHGSKVVKLLQPVEPQKLERFNDKDLITYACGYGDIYYSVLAEVERPKGKGYWASNIIILPGDDIDEKLVGFSEKERLAAKKAILPILAQGVYKPGGTSFLEAYNAKTDVTKMKPEDVKTNTSHYGMSLYKSPRGGFEIFYNAMNSRVQRPKRDKK